MDFRDVPPHPSLREMVGMIRQVPASEPDYLFANLWDAHSDTGTDMGPADD